MEEKSEVDKLFSNYLRNLYIKPTKEELAWVKSKIPLITDKSWCAIISDARKVKSLLSYYLILNKCPNYEYYTSIDLVEQRFNDENSIRNLVDYEGILILRHSATFIRNKLTLETLLHIIAERVYKDKAVIVISDILSDKTLDLVYYDHKKVTNYIPCDLALKTLNASSKNTPVMHKISSVKSSASSKPHSSRPLANVAMERGEKYNTEQHLKDRSKLIEESAGKCNID